MTIRQLMGYRGDFTATIYATKQEVIIGDVKARLEALGRPGYGSLERRVALLIETAEIAKVHLEIFQYGSSD